MEAATLKTSHRYVMSLLLLRFLPNLTFSSQKPGSLRGSLPCLRLNLSLLFFDCCVAVKQVLETLTFIDQGSSKFIYPAEENHLPSCFRDGNNTSGDYLPEHFGSETRNSGEKTEEASVSSQGFHTLNCCPTSTCERGDGQWECGQR